MKYYAVRKGRETGIFDNWPEYQNSIKGFSLPEYRSFNTREKAESYV